MEQVHTGPANVAQSVSRQASLQTCMHATQRNGRARLRRAHKRPNTLNVGTLRPSAKSQPPLIFSGRARDDTHPPPPAALFAWRRQSALTHELCRMSELECARAVEQRVAPVAGASRQSYRALLCVDVH